MEYHEPWCGDVSLSRPVDRGTRADSPEALPRRGDAVDRWLKEWRDDFKGFNGDDVWAVLDDMLDDYRLHADTGTALDADVSEGDAAT